MKKFLKELYEKHSTWIIAGLIVLIVVLTAYFNYQLDKKQKKIDEIEYVDTTGTYHKLYYESNKSLFDFFNYFLVDEREERRINQEIERKLGLI